MMSFIYFLIHLSVGWLDDILLWGDGERWCSVLSESQWERHKTKMLDKITDLIRET